MSKKIAIGIIGSALLFGGIIAGLKKYDGLAIFLGLALCSLVYELCQD